MDTSSLKEHPKPSSGRGKVYMGRIGEGKRTPRIEIITVMGFVLFRMKVS